MKALRDAVFVFSTALAVFHPLCACAESDGSVHLGISYYATPAPNEIVYERTIETIRKAVAPRKLKVPRYSPGKLADAVSADKLDILFGSSGFYRRNAAAAGFRELVSLASSAYPNPNHSDGAAIVVRADREDLRSVADLAGKTLSGNERYTFTGYFVPMGAVADAGFDPLAFFGKTILHGEGQTMPLIADDVLSGAADVGFLRLCMLETLEKSGRIPNGALRVIAEKSKGLEPCRRSTDLYPGWTVSTTPNASPLLAGMITLALLRQAPVGNNLHWAIASNYQSVDALYQKLQLGPYEHLRAWSIERFVMRYWPWLFLFIILLLILAASAWYWAGKSAAQTKALKAAFHRERRLEKASRDAQERLSAMQKVQAIGQLSSMIAHEIRQPLTSIRSLSLGLLRFMERGACTEEMTKENLALIAEQAARADAVIERVRQYAKTPVQTRHPVLVSDLVHQAIHNALLGKHLSQDMILLAETHCKVLGCADELQIALLNLIKNGLDATQKLSNPQIDIRVSCTSEQVFIRIADNGPALTDDAFEALSSPLHSTKENGLGLGIAIVRTIIESHGGSLRFERQNPGLAALITLPRAQE